MSKKTGGLLLVSAFLSSGALLGQAPEPLTLRRAIERALARAPGLAVTRARSDQAGASARLASDAFHPELVATTTPGYATGLPVAVAGRVPAIAGVELRQTLYNPALRSEAYEARARAAALEGDLEWSRAETVRSAATLYARLWAAQAILASLRRRAEADEAFVRRTEALRREGRSTELDVERATLELARARQKLLDAESDRDLDQRALRRLVDWPADRPLALAEEPLSALPETSAGDDVAVSRAADPRLQALERRIEDLRAARRISARAWAPVVEAEAQYSRLSRANNFDEFYAKFKADDFSVGIGIAIPLWTGGRRADAAARVAASLGQAEAERRGRQEEIEDAVRRARAEADRATARLSLTRRAAGVMEEGLRVTRLLAEEGRAEPSDVEKQQRAAADSQEEVAAAALALAAARLELLQLRGDLSAAFLREAKSPATVAAATAD